jgi:hypothetical protein
MNPFTNSIGFGAYDNFGEDIEEERFKGPVPLRLVRAEAGIDTITEAGPETKKYRLEAGMTPLSIFLGISGMVGFVTLIYVWRTTALPVSVQ